MQHAGGDESYEEQVAASDEALGLAPRHRHGCRGLCFTGAAVAVRSQQNDFCSCAYGDKLVQPADQSDKWCTVVGVNQLGFPAKKYESRRSSYRGNNRFPAFGCLLEEQLKRDVSAENASGEDTLATPKRSRASLLLRA